MKLRACIQQTYIDIHFVPDTVLDAGDRTAVDTALEVFMKDRHTTMIIICCVLSSRHFCFAKKPQKGEQRTHPGTAEESFAEAMISQLCMEGQIRFMEPMRVGKTFHAGKATSQD